MLERVELRRERGQLSGRRCRLQHLPLRRRQRGSAVGSVASLHGPVPARVCKNFVAGKRRPSARGTVHNAACSLPTSDGPAIVGRRLQRRRGGDTKCRSRTGQGHCAPARLRRRPGGRPAERTPYGPWLRTREAGGAWARGVSLFSGRAAA